MPAPARPRSPVTSPKRVDGKVLFAAFTGKAALVMRSKGCERASTIHSLIYKARESGEEVAELRPLGRRAGVEGEADRDRRMLDGRCRARPRPDVVRRAAAGAGRSGATAADPGRRLLHRRRARRDADRGAPAGARTIRSSGCRWTSAKAAAWTPGVYGETAGRDARRARSAARARRRPGAGRPQRDAARLQRAHARAPRLRRRHCRPPATSWSACATTAQGTVQRRAVVGEGEADHAARHHQDAACSRTTASRGQGIKVSVRPECFTGGIEAARMAAAQALRRVRLRLRAHRAQGAGLAVGRRRAVRRVVCVPARAASAGSTPASRGPRSG